MKFSRTRMLSLLAALWLAPFAGQAADDKSAAVKSLDAAEDVTVITADRLTFDYKKKYAMFEDNVVVTDPELQMTSSRLTVTFDEKGKLTGIKAEGKVNLRQDDKNATADLASYDVSSGKIVLAGHPRVARGRDILEGDVITFWRDENRMICQPQARLVIYPQDGSSDEMSRELMLGE